MATGRSWLGKTRKWFACGWAAVQLDYDEEMEPLHGMYGSMEAELEIQRTIKRAELTAFLMPSQESDGTPGKKSTTSLSLFMETIWP